VPIHSFTLRSNDGHHSVEWEVAGFAETGLIADTTLWGLCWSTDDTPEAYLTAKGVLIDSRLLGEFEDGLRRWVELPLDDQVKKPLRVGLKLVSGRGDHQLELRFGPREDLIPSGSNPVVTVIYKFGRLSGEFSFTTDQSCLRNLCEEIRGIPKP
jgi:hypothetical protein